ncbi:nucleotide-binding oligomerization domain-containing protein 2-like [Amphiura filiformis]|uniref:nucleotide-binding oligomerization domain-containing protein 2-like n=1 Tax=Amphiura filiformis TaxID=82378 RepID=UPI003B21A3F3
MKEFLADEFQGIAACEDEVLKQLKEEREENKRREIAFGEMIEEKVKPIKRSQTDSCGESDLKGCRDALVDYYTRTYGKIKKYPWSSSYSEMIPLGEVFTNISMLIEKPGLCQSAKEPLQAYEEMFTRRSNENKPFTRMILKGRPGCGKTTVVEKIAYDWAVSNLNPEQMDENRKPNKNTATGAHQSPWDFIDLLFLLKIRWIDKDAELVDVIFAHELLPEDSNFSPESLLQIIKANEHRVCIIIDGYDESRINYMSEDQSGSLSKLLKNLV